VAVTSSVENLIELADQRHRDPGEVLRRARDLLVESSSPALEATARWVAGLALHELGNVPEAIESYHRAIEISTERGLRDVESQARAGLAISLVSAGEAGAAAAQIGRARAVATPTTRGVVEMLYGLVQQRTGHLAQAQATYSRALRRLQEPGEATSIARLRLNRGILRAYRGDSHGAVEDLLAAEQIATDRDLPVLAAMAAHNLGFAYGRRGDVPQAIGAFNRAEHAYRAASAPESLSAVLDADRCEVLLLAGLVVEATTAARSAVSAVARTGDLAYLAECRLLLARSMLAGGEYGEANEHATAVGEEFRAAGRLPWAALADYVSIQAAMYAREDGAAPPAGFISRAQAVAAELEAQGWVVEAGQVRLFAGQVALAAGQPDLTRAELARAVTSRRRGTADLQAQSWYASALLRVGEGDLRGAKRALTRGLRLVDEHVATLGATELRARAASYGSDLARLGTSLAVEARHPGEALRWAEQWRASALRHPPVRPPDDDQLVSDLAELRHIRSELRQAALDGDPAERLDRLERRAVSIESAIRRRLLEARGDAVTSRWLSAAELRRMLGARVLVEYLDVNGRLYAVTVTPSRSRLIELGPLAPVEQELTHLQFALRRSLRHGAGASGSESLVTAGAERLDRMLLTPLGLAASVPIVLVPTASLQALPWGCLQSLADRDVTVAPSAALWARDAGRGVGGITPGPDAGGGPAGARSASRPAGPDSGGVLLIAGPGLPGAEREVQQLANLYPDARLLAGPDAIASRVLEELGKARLVHLAAHGTFRTDSPLFSSFLLADGPLTVHDLEGAAIAADTVVLAACNAGVSGVIGNQLIGTGASLLGLGVRTIVAPLLAIPDAPTASFMVGLHRALLAGLPASAALAAARSGRDAAVASVFVCLGRDGGRQA
jgi:hypothetical protein